MISEEDKIRAIQHIVYEIHKGDPLVAEKCDVFAVDYGFPQAELPFPAAMKKRVNREVSHLTYFRNQAVERPWTNTETTEVMKPLCSRFLLHVLNLYPGIEDEASPYYTDKWLTYTAFHCITALKARLGITFIPKP